jgi:hypothetical protein
MFIACTLFSVGFMAGLGVWWLSLDRCRGKEVRDLASLHHLPVDAVHEAAVRALRSGFVEDFTFLVRKAHPRVENEDTLVRLAERKTARNNDVLRIEAEHTAS